MRELIASRACPAGRERSVTPSFPTAAGTSLIRQRAAGEPIFYRKGGLDHRALSTTTDPKGARSGSSYFKPDHVFTYDELRKAGYRLLSGPRGMVGLTSSQEREHIWLKPRGVK